MDRPTLCSGFLALAACLALAGCHKAPRQHQSLVGDFPAPGAFALAADTITVWKRVPLPDGTSRFRSYSITPGGTVEFLDEAELGDAPANPEEETTPEGEQRRGFALPRSEFEAIRGKAALLRPASLGPDDPVGGYGGEAVPAGCALDKAKPRIAGVNFLNGVNWGSFVLQPGCSSDSAAEATAAVTEIFDRLERGAAGQAQQAQR